MKELEEKRQQLVHEDEVKKWNGYVYHTPGEYDRLQLYAGEMQAMGECVLQPASGGGDKHVKQYYDVMDYTEFEFLSRIDSSPGSESHAKYSSKDIRRAAQIASATKKFKSDLEAIGKYPEDAPKQRLVMIQTLLIRLIDVLDPNLPNSPPPLVRRDFRLYAFKPITPVQEGYLRDLEDTVLKIKERCQN